MVETDRIYESKVKFTGLFDFKDLYNFLFTWLSDYGYGKIEEKSYSEKIKPEGKEIEISWNATRTISDYFRFLLKIGWRILRMTSVEVQKGDHKMTLNKADVEIKITGFLEKDYEHRWETSPFLKFLRSIYDKFIIKTRVEEYGRKVMEEVDELVAQTKSYLEMEGKRL